MSPRSNQPTWTSLQAYGLAVFTFALGITLGVLFRGSGASPASSEPVTSAPASSAANAPQGSSSGGFTIPSMNSTLPGSGAGQSAAAIEQAAGPLLDALKRNPADFEALVKLGNLYYDGQKYQEAVGYYERALKVRPENPDVRTDMGTAYWYMGNADRAIAEFTQSLKYRPGYAQTLFNLGIVRWQGKNDAAGAIKAWEELLAKNPNYPEKQKVLDSIQQAKSGG